MRNPYELKRTFGRISRFCLTAGLVFMVWNGLAQSNRLIGEVGLGFWALSFVFYGLYWYADYQYRLSMVYRNVSAELRRTMVMYEMFAASMVAFSIAFALLYGRMSAPFDGALAVTYIVGFVVRVFLYPTEK